MLTVRDIAVRLRVSAACVYQLIETGRLAHHRIGTGRGAIRVSEADLQTYLDRCRVQEGRMESPKPATPKRKVTLKHLKL